MMQKLLLFITTCVLNNQLFAQNLLPIGLPIPYRHAELWGFADIGNNKELLPTIYDSTYIVNNSCYVIKNKKYGMCTNSKETRTQEIIAPIYDSLKVNYFGYTGYLNDSLFLFSKNGNVLFKGKYFSVKGLSSISGPDNYIVATNSSDSNQRIFNLAKNTWVGNFDYKVIEVNWHIVEKKWNKKFNYILYAKNKYYYINDADELQALNLITADLEEITKLEELDRFRFVEYTYEYKNFKYLQENLPNGNYELLFKKNKVGLVKNELKKILNIAKPQYDSITYCEISSESPNGAVFLLWKNKKATLVLKDSVLKNDVYDFVQYDPLLYCIKTKSANMYGYIYLNYLKSKRNLQFFSLKEIVIFKPNYKSELYCEVYGQTHFGAQLVTDLQGKSYFIAATGLIYYTQ